MVYPHSYSKKGGFACFCFSLHKSLQFSIFNSLASDCLHLYKVWLSNPSNPLVQHLENNIIKLKPRYTVHLSKRSTDLQPLVGVVRCQCHTTSHLTVLTSIFTLVTSSYNSRSRVQQTCCKSFLIKVGFPLYDALWLF